MTHHVRARALRPMIPFLNCNVPALAGPPYFARTHWVNICRIRLPRAGLSRLREGASITVRTEEFRGSYVGWGSADRGILTVEICSEESQVLFG